MEKVDFKHEELRLKIEKGLKLTFEKLLKTKLQNDGTFVFSDNGVIIKVKAKDMVEYLASKSTKQIE